MNKKTLKSIGAVVAGFVVVVVLSLGTDVVLHAAGVFPPWDQRMSDALFLLATVYRTIYCIGGSYIAARLAPNRAMAHALGLGVMGFIISTAGAVATWNRGPELGPTGLPSRSFAPRLPGPGLGANLA